MSWLKRGARYAVGRLCSMLPKDPKKAVFQSFNGRGYSDSPKAIAQELLDRGGWKLYWLVKDQQEARSLPEGVRPVLRGSLAEAYHLHTAGAWVDNCRKWGHLWKRPSGIPSWWTCFCPTAGF